MKPRLSDNLGLVISQAKSYSPTRVTDIDDYIQVGCIALLLAIEKYDKTKGNWSTYAVKAIKRAIFRERKRFLHTAIKFKDHEYIEKTNLLDYLPKSLTQLELQIIKLKLENNSLEEIGNLIGFSKQWISLVLKDIYNKIRAANE